MATPLIHEAVVAIRYVDESRTRGTWHNPLGKRRFVIGAEKQDGPDGLTRHISFSTLDPWKASLCSQARDKRFLVAVKYRGTRYFDADLLWVGMVEPGTVPTEETRTV